MAEITEQVRLGQGAISEWLRIGPFSEKVAPPVGVMLPDEQLDVAKEYDTPAGKISWTAISTPSPRLEMKDLIEGKEPGTVYAVAALRFTPSVGQLLPRQQRRGGALRQRQAPVQAKRRDSRGGRQLDPGDDEGRAPAHFWA